MSLSFVRPNLDEVDREKNPRSDISPLTHKPVTLLIKIYS